MERENRRQHRWTDSRVATYISDAYSASSTVRLKARKRPGSTVLSFQTFRQVSPLLLPLLMGGASFVLLAIAILSAPASWHVLVDATSLLPLFFVLAAVGVITGTAMAYAPNETIWAMATVSGLIAYGTIIVWAMFGWPPAITLVLGLLLSTIVIVRSQLHMVREYTVHVMILFGKYHRTLRPGFNLRFPGEQVLAILPTTETTVNVTIEDAILRNGTRVDLQATASCQIVPEQANLAAAHADNWLQEVQNALELAVKETLCDADPDELTHNGMLIDTFPLAARVTGHLQQFIGRSGIAVLWVRIHSLCMPQTEEEVLRELPATTPKKPPSPDVLTEQEGERGRTVNVREVRSTIQMPRGTTPGVILPLPPSMHVVPHAIPAPQALAQAYNAVRDRRITEPQTIRRIARAFEAIADDAIQGPLLPFDAHEAALYLRALADKQD
jgi:SPFH domain / Band 7 family